MCACVREAGDRCVEVVARSVRRKKGEAEESVKAADKLSVSGIIHCCTRGHDLAA